jgi:hypothetical protein
VLADSSGNIGVPLLVQVMKEEGMYDSHPSAGKPFDSRRLELKEDFTKKRGYWHSFWEGMWCPPLAVVLAKLTTNTRRLSSIGSRIL